MTSKTIKARVIFVLALVIVIVFSAFIFTEFTGKPEKVYAAYTKSADHSLMKDESGNNFTCHYNDVIAFDVYPTSSDTVINFCIIQGWSAYRGYFNFDLAALPATDAYRVEDNGDGGYTVTLALSKAGNASCTPDTELASIYKNTNGGGSLEYYFCNFRMVAESTEGSSALFYNGTGNYVFNFDYSGEMAGITYSFKMDDASKKLRTLICKDWSNYYGWYSINATPESLKPLNGVYLQQLGTGDVKVTVIFDEATNKAGTVDLLDFIIIDQVNTTGSGAIYNVHIFTDYHTVAVNGVTTKVGDGDKMTVSAADPAAGKHFVGWSDGSDILSQDEDYTFTVNDDIELTAVYADNRASETHCAKGTQIAITPFAGDAINKVAFDYRITDGGSMTICVLNSAWGIIQDYFGIDKYGLTSAVSGVSSEYLSDGYVRVTIEKDGMNASNILFTQAGRNNADTYIDNVEFCNNKYTVTVNNGTGGGSVREGHDVTVTADPPSGKYFHHWEIGGESVSTDASYTIEDIDGDVEITAVCYDYRGTNVTANGVWASESPYDILYDTVTFEYKPVGTNTARICLFQPWSKYYGYYTFDSAGTVNHTNGISITPLADGYYRVVMTVSLLDYTNGFNNLDNAPDQIEGIWSAPASDWYIDNVSWYKACAVTVTNGTGGTTVNYGSSVTVTANSAPEGKFFAGWSDGESIVSENSSYTFTVTGDVSLTATYGDIYTVSVTGGTIGGESSADVVEGQSATVVAGAAAAGKYFHHWEIGGESVSTDAEYTFTVDGDVEITAVYYDFRGDHITTAGVAFATAPYDLDYDTVTFEYKPVGSNTVKICLLNKNWSKYYGYYTFSSTGTVDKPAGISITPLNDGYFRVTMTTASLTWTNSANNRNNVPEHIHCFNCGVASDWYIDNVSWYKACAVTVTNGTGGTTVNYGSSVTVTANSAPVGKFFAGWSDGESIVSENSSYTFTVTGDVSLTATYGDIYTVSVTGGTISGESSAEIIEGQEATVVAGAPVAGKYFHHWEIGGESVSTDAEYTFTVDGDVEITAVCYDYRGTNVTANGVWASESPYDILYDTVTFEYKTVGTNTARICLFQPWSKFYGYYTFDSAGTVNHTNGISITPLADGYYRVVMTIASLDYTNNANNLDNAPDQIEGIWSTPASDWYIDNVSWYKACAVTVINGTGGTTVNYGSSVTVTANDAPIGKVFSCWKDGSGNLVSNDASYTFTVTGDVALTAYYSDIITVSVSGGQVNGASSANVGDGSSVTLVANAPAAGYYFLNWTNTAGDTVATTSTAEVIVNGATTYTANYRAFDGTNYPAYTNHSIYPATGKPFIRISFEYKIASGEQSEFALLNNWSNFYGYFTITPNGLKTVYNGVNAEFLADGYYRVSIDIADITSIMGTMNPATTDITQIFIRNSSSANIYIRNVTFIEETGVFRMYEGASVRLTDPYGIRFRAFMSFDMYDVEATYGMIILPYDYIVDNEIDLEGDVMAQLNSKSVKYRNFTCTPIQMASTNYYIQGSLTNILPQNLTREFIGIGYYILGGEYHYVQNATSCRRTIVGVSESAIKNYQAFTGYTAEKQEFLLETSGSEGVAAGAAFSANAFDSIENFRKNDSVSTSATLALSAAKGESEFGQIVLTATSAVANKAYIIIPNDLTHSDGSTVLDKANFELFNAYYINVDSNWVYWDKAHFSYVTDIATGYYVNALVPFYAASANSEAVFDRTNGDNQTIFVRFNIPEGQKAGVYTGSFRIYVLGIGYKDVSVSFTVNNFTLPEENNYKSKYGISQYAIADVFGTSSSRTTEEYADLYDFLLDYNLNGGQLSTNSLYYGAEAIDGYIAKLVESYNNPKISAIQLDCNYGPAYYEYKKSSFSATKTYDLSSVIYEYDRVMSDGAESYGTRSTLKAIAEYCVENDINLFEKLYFRLSDEPATPELCIQAILSYNAVKNGVAYALSEVDFTGHEDIEASLRYLPYIVTVYPSEQIKDDYGATVLSLYSGNKFVDSVYSQTAYYPADENNSRQDIVINNKYLTDYVPTYDKVIGSDMDSRANTIRTDADPNTHLWWYPMITTVNPYPNYVVNADQIINRSKAWATYYYGIEGELYYCVNAWWEYHYINQAEETSDYTILDEAAIWNGEAVYFGGYEDGTLVYPNVTRYAGDFKYCPTYRLVATREGIDDYNYICYAQSLIDGLSAGSYKTAKQSALDGYVASMVNTGAADAIINNNAATLRTARNNLIALIEELEGYGA